jgi:hypothetical protein
MPYLVVTSLYPPEKAPECGERYLEALKKYPPDENLGTQVVPAAVKSTLKGTKSIGILEVKEGKLEEAFTLMVRFMSVFRGIEGFKTSIDVYYNAAEAMANIGMSIPDE